MAVSSPARSSGTSGQTALPANFRQKAPEIHGSLGARAFVGAPGDRRGCQRISGKRRRKPMAVSSPARSSGTWGQSGLPANFRQKAPEIHGSLVSPRTATRSVTRVDVRIAGSRLPVAVSVIVAATGARIVAPAVGDAYADAKVWAGPEASTVVIASAGVEPAGVVTASRAAVCAAIIAAPARIAATRIRGGIATPTAGIAATRVGGGIATPTAGIAAAGVGRGRIAASTAAGERTAGETAAVPVASPATALGQCGRRADQHQERAKRKRRHGGFERYCLHCPIHEHLQSFRRCNVQATHQFQVFENRLLTHIERENPG